MSRHRLGVALAIAAYTQWGLFPLYWPLLKPAGSVEILLHRIVKKYLNLPGQDSFAAETITMFLPVAAGIAMLQAAGHGTFTSMGVAHALLLAGGGVVTVGPLLCFGAAACWMAARRLALALPVADALRSFLKRPAPSDLVPPIRSAS